MGRKKTDNPRKNTVNVRFSDKELKELEKHVKQKTGKSILSRYIRNEVMKNIPAR